MGKTKRIAAIARGAATVLLLTVAAAPAPAEGLEEIREFHIEAQPLDAALIEFSEQADLQLVVQTELVAGRQSAGVDGALTASAALLALLNDTGLQFEAVGEDTVAVSQADARGDSEAGNGRTAGAKQTPVMMTQASREPYRTTEQRTSAVMEQRDRKIEEIIITGTRIKGARPSSPVVTITQDEMRLSGQNNLGDVIRALPQNFSGGQNPGVSLQGAAANNISNQNVGGGSALSLRGLGPDATLTLLNGSRMAYNGFTQATDVSVIPVAAIERVEILLDGASAVYGSDAVAGVANIVLKRDYRGAELSVRYGAATDGGYEQQQYTALAGHNWGSGGFLITADLSNNTEVTASQRDYLSYMSYPDSAIFPELDQKSGLFSGHQELGDVAELTVDAFYTERDENFLQGFSDPASAAERDRRSNVWGISPSLRVMLPVDWSLRLYGFAGSNEVESETSCFAVGTGAQTCLVRTGYFNKTEAAGIEAEGPLFSLPGGMARLSVGGGYRRNEFDQVNLVSGATTIEGSERASYVYGETNLPLISEEQGIPLVRRFELNGALRYEHYSLAGGSTTPKIGAVWTLVSGLDLKGSWGRSFKAPTLAQLYEAPTLNQYNSSSVGGAAVGAPPDATALAQFGGSLALRPERADVVTVGFQARPEVLPGFSLEVSWFNIDYTDRVVRPVNPFSQAIPNPAFADFVTPNPSIAEQNAAFSFAGLPVGTFTFNNAGVPYDPANVIAIVENQYANAASDKVRGVDLTARYTTQVSEGLLSLNASANWITNGARQLTDLSPEVPIAGVIYFPPKFKVRFGASWSRDGFTFSSNVNHIGGVKDTNVTPSPQGDSITTLDLVADYQMDTGPLGSIGFNLAVTNLFDQHPPFLQPLNASFPNYDSTNYSALGRVVSAMVTKRF